MVERHGAAECLLRPGASRRASKLFRSTWVVSSRQTGVICTVAVDLCFSNVVDVADYVVSELLLEEVFWG